VLRYNWLNIRLRLTGWPNRDRAAVIDMLEPFYNWVIPIDCVREWMKKAGFSEVVRLNEGDTKPCAWHFLGLNKQD